ncbi:hypothetical protein [Streptomyces sp. NPDC059761]|uniref:hypothetical protein n=1 Tax=Streptomyces sp. NPDC059761 TaxID=3346937 RepID=UPI003658E131
MWKYWIVTLDAAGREVVAEAVPMPVPPKGGVDLVGARPMAAIVHPGAFDDDDTAKPELVMLGWDGSVSRRISLVSDAELVENLLPSGSLRFVASAPELRECSRTLLGTATHASRDAGA